MINYYKIIDLNLIAKKEEHIPYIYDAEKGEWTVDKDNILTDRLMGYDEDRIGGSSMMNRIQEITDEEVEL